MSPKGTFVGRTHAPTVSRPARQSCAMTLSGIVLVVSPKGGPSMRLLSACALLLTLTACSEDPLSSVASGLIIYPSTSVARPGDQLTVHLINGSGQDLSQNLCPLALQQKQGSIWASIYVEPVTGSACPALSISFPSGQAIKRTLTLPAGLAPGQYRVIFQWLSLKKGPELPEDLRASKAFDVRLSLPL